ncbi:MAG: stage III sporulation protein D [Ruminococcaceae bacterium]|nr:stage III sporulation protein D [Oscillospiraceae bacterium]
MYINKTDFYGADVLLKRVVLKGDIRERIIKEGEFVAESGATVRHTAEKFGISKSTVHKDLAKRLKSIDNELYIKVSKVLADNRAERHIRGGMATKVKYLAEKENKKSKS